MKVVVLGGAGVVGSEAVGDLAAAAQVGKVIVADSNRRKAERLCESVGRKAEFEKIDALDHDQVVKVMSRGDVALSCLGPFSFFEEKMVRAALSARVNYVSVCDDIEAVEATLALDREIRRAGICALSGMGWTPGLSNILARKGMMDMDKPARINISWAANAGDPMGPKALRHILRAYTGHSPTRDGGRWINVPAGSGQEIVEFPEPVGRTQVCHLGHPEIVTIPHFYGGIEQVTVKGGLAPAGLNSLARTMARMKMADSSGKRERAAAFLNSIAPVFGKTGEGMSALRVDVHGEKDFQTACFSFMIIDTIRRLIGIPAAIGTVMMGAGLIKRKGFATPEVAVDPGAFIGELSKRKVKVINKIES